MGGEFYTVLYVFHCFRVQVCESLGAYCFASISKTLELSKVPITVYMVEVKLLYMNLTQAASLSVYWGW